MVLLTQESVITAGDELARVAHAHGGWYDGWGVNVLLGQIAQLEADGHGFSAPLEIAMVVADPKPAS